MKWIIPDAGFQPAKQIPPDRGCIVNSCITQQLSPVQISHKLFPHSLYEKKWQDTKEVMVLSNRHLPKTTTVKK